MLKAVLNLKLITMNISISQWLDNHKSLNIDNHLKHYSQIH